MSAIENMIGADLAGVTRTLSEWARVTGLHVQTIRARLALGWDIGRALTQGGAT